MKDPCPCYGCPDRSADPNCHSYDGVYCSHGYSEWAERRRKEREARQAQEQRDAAADRCKIDALRKIYKHQKRSWKR